MKLIAILLIFCCTIETIISIQFLKASSENKHEDSNITAIEKSAVSLIVNGAASRQRLFYARIRFHFNSNVFCGAAILDERFVMTAAHCVYSSHRKTSSFFWKIFGDLFRLWPPPNRLVGAYYLHPLPTHVPYFYQLI